MSIVRLSIQGVRNIANTQFHPGPGVNVLHGDNGAGKSSVLEAIHLLALARSFKVSRTRTLIRDGDDQAVVFAELDSGTRIGVQRSRNGQHGIRVNGEPVAAVSELAHRLPLQLIHSDSFLLLEGSPGHRRQFLDWGVFHQDTAFHAAWQNAQKSLKNRNSLLRSGRIDRSQLAVWQREFLLAAEHIDALRKHYLEGFVPLFHQVLDQLIELPDLRIHYYRGWDKSRTLADVLDNQWDRDIKLGYTQSGPQRADMRIKVRSQAASDVLSRGQQKLVVCALKVAQSLHLQAEHNRPTTFLVDDLPAELDRHHIRKLGSLMEGLTGQVFMTSVDPAPLHDFWQSPDRIRMFHVEQGQVFPADDLEQPDE
ncbi:DNA replication/repair protein RecF [Saccharospirillum salsuginis]|uniref:DNA replication and repair protein RecF n=1 Tax=Saccharospirillum salsuginis TaxID=418750 RepID=A0A918K3Y9_9GAMM|nr:DNA replication/repair protein RecF [Saccharospirillum salsuginis]GGX48177.1 DNA replication and repair protein RecF [Saccharospirillum salsuginis]